MPTTSRRQFLTGTAAGFGALLGLQATPLGMPIGCQSWPVRTQIAKDFVGTIKDLAADGFQSVELCSPVGYATAGFGGLTQYKGSEIRTMLSDQGVNCQSAHFSMKELWANQEERIAWAKDAGLTQMLVASLGGPRQPTMDDVKRAAEEYNEMGEVAARSGIQQGLHNENFEISTVDGRRTYDALMELLDPALIKFQFQVSTISAGYDAAEYFRKYPGRFVSMHVQDWSAESKQIVAVGQGTLDWQAIFSAAKVGGIKNYFVEMNPDLMKASVPYLRKLKV